MKSTAVFGVVLGAVVSVTAGPILRPSAANVLASSESNSLAKRGFMDDLLEEFIATLNYPDDMTKRSTDVVSSSDRRIVLETVALANMDAFTAYIDNMDDEAVSRALSDSEISNSMYTGPQGALDISVSDEMALGLFTLLPRAESNKYGSDSESTNLNTDFETGHDADILKRDMGDWVHNKCRFKAGFHHDQDEYYCNCLGENIEVDDLFPECCREYLGDRMGPRKRPVDDGHGLDDDTVDTPPSGPLPMSTIDTVATTNLLNIAGSVDAGDEDNDDYLEPHDLTDGVAGECYLNCRFQASWYLDPKGRYENCLIKCQSLKKRSASLKRSTSTIDNEDNTAIATKEAENNNFLDRISEFDDDLSMRLIVSPPKYGSQNLCNRAAEVSKCRLEAGWHPFGFKKHYEECMRECNRERGNGV